MGLINKFIINCETSAHYCDKLQYNEASSIERVQYKMHVYLCKLCKSHSDRNSKLTTACKSAKLTTMPKDDKAILKAKLEKQMNQ